MNPHEHMPSLEEIEAEIKAGQERIVRERLRDAFAAAALTGLLADGEWPADCEVAAAEEAYRHADAMLRERGTAVRDNCFTGNQREMECPVTEPMPKEKRSEVSGGIPKNHDAAPAARAACEDCQPQAAAESGNPVRSSNAGCTGNTKKPVAWAVMDVDWFHDVRLMQSGAEWYAGYLNDKQRKSTCHVVPLYRSPTLTDEERAAITDAIAAYEDITYGYLANDEKAASTLRKLLERLT